MRATADLESCSRAEEIGVLEGKGKGIAGVASENQEAWII